MFPINKSKWACETDPLAKLLQQGDLLHNHAFGIAFNKTLIKINPMLSNTAMACRSIT